jgi:hypothetical protein
VSEEDNSNVLFHFLFHSHSFSLSLLLLFVKLFTLSVLLLRCGPVEYSGGDDLMEAKVKKETPFAGIVFSVTEG